MTGGLAKLRILLGALLLLPMVVAVSTIVTAQGTPTTPSKDDKQSVTSAAKQDESSAKGEKKPLNQPPLELGLKPVSTADAARSAAQKLAKRRNVAGQEARTEGADAGKSAAEQAGNSPVDEFRPAPQSNPEVDGGLSKSKDSKKSLSKNVHGTAYGALDPRNRKDHDAAASVGASSKSGKTSVYVETERSRASTQPH